MRILYWEACPEDPAGLAAAVNDLGPDIVVLDLAARAAEVLRALCGADPAWTGVEQLPDEPGALVLATRLPLLAAQSERDVTYRMGAEERRMRYGILDAAVQLPAGAPLHVVGVSVKDKTFDPSGQTEMRRSELRLVGRHLRRLVETVPSSSILVLGALNDLPAAAPVRALIDDPATRLKDLRPLDSAGDAWTAREPETDVHLRHHYALIRPDLPAVARILDGPALRAYSPHRPLWIELPGEAPRTGSTR